MRSIVSVFLFFLFLLPACSNCTQQKSVALGLTTGSTVSVPVDAVPANVTISSLNYWTERGRYFVTGICDNNDTEWQRIYLKIEPLDAEGKPLTINGEPSASFATLSEAVPPRGRTSFFAEWPLEAFSGVPDSCIISGAGSVLLYPGPILVSLETNGVKMMVQDTLPNDSVVLAEKAWQVSTVIENPLEMQAPHPRVELLLFGTDERLWFATVLNPEDEATKKTVVAERDGSMVPQERRRIGAIVFYDNLPQALKDKKIGRVVFQPFNAPGDSNQNPETGN
ncbi:MAG: hypothetical protein KDC61_18030 [Saprospiraceae bacterium]|nr:hypothetical protein [Saprospiraceae bacterium]MCB0543927.1 hypothetical protein [Saprospiraceae bacterium]MCB0576460.1 hypothetical protein [Saprospiraceae bacterium]MCB9353778.1 hypothetical protein [Lewinellaceae bacterium]